MDGDKIELTVEKCGTLHIKVRDPLKRTWARITRLQHKESGAEACTPSRPAANTRKSCRTQILARHARPRAGIHALKSPKTWMAGTSPAMTTTKIPYSTDLSFRVSGAAG